MAITIHPRIGAVLVCDYDTGFRVPEMVKRRPVIVVSPRLRDREGLCTVVPLSTTEAVKQHPFHCRLRFDPRLPHPYDHEWMWVKADMIATVGFHRLAPLRKPKDQYGKRQYDNRIVDPPILAEIRKCVLHALGFSSLVDSGAVLRVGDVDG